MSKRCMLCFISGRVQGVGFRAATKTKAQELGIKGWVKNLPDKRVEALLCGEPGAIDTMRDWLWHGPSAAKVNDVACEEIACQTFAEFTIQN